jgi:hypothetical protein
MQVGVCSGMVLGFLATVLAVHLIMSRRPGGVQSKGSTSPVGNYSASVLSPGEPLVVYSNPASRADVAG